MTISICDLFRLSKERFRNAGALDTFLDEDIPLFISPALLKRTSIPELKPAYGRVLDHFRTLVSMLESSSGDDEAFQRALAFFRFREAYEIGLGHGQHGTSGEAKKDASIKVAILETVRQMVQAGIKEPETFEVAAWLAPRMGPDRISDMLASIARNEFRDYSTRVFREAGLTERKFKWKDGFLPAHPFLKTEDGSAVEVHLVPLEILSSAQSANEDLRELTTDLRRIMLPAVSKGRTEKANARKKRAIETITRHPDQARNLIDKMRSLPGKPYPSDDPLGLFTWYEAALILSEKFVAPHEGSTLFEAAAEQCDWFAGEIGTTWTDLYSGDKARKETFAQREFWKAVHQKLRENGIEFVRDPDIGRGKPDFLMSSNGKRVIIEMKLTHYRRLRHCLNQLREYIDVQPGTQGIMMVIHVDGKDTARLLDQFRAEAEKQNDPRITIRIIDGRRKKRPHEL